MNTLKRVERAAERVRRARAALDAAEAVVRTAVDAQDAAWKERNDAQEELAAAVGDLIETEAVEG